MSGANVLNDATPLSTFGGPPHEWGKRLRAIVVVRSKGWTPREWGKQELHWNQVAIERWTPT